MKHFARDEGFHGRRVLCSVHVKIEDLFPHRHEKTEMPRLSRIFLRDLQLDGFICFVECAEKRRSWLTHLEINRAILDLQNDVCVELPVEFVEIVVGRAGSVVFQIAPIEMMVVDKPAIKKQTAVWFECASNKVRAIRVRSAIRRWADPAFGI